MKFPRLITRRRAKWVGTAASAALVGVIVASCFVWYVHGWDTPVHDRLIMVDRGSVQFDQSSHDQPGTLFLKSVLENGFSSSRGMSPIWWPRYQGRGSTGYMSVRLPLWPLLLLIAAPTAWLFRLGRRVKPWQCPKCRYDLRGLEGGVCPECGTAKATMRKGAM